MTRDDNSISEEEKDLSPKEALDGGSAHAKLEPEGDNLKYDCDHKSGGRNLVVCLDGTSNQFGNENTNVIEMYSMVDKDDNQCTWYNSGVGTYAQPHWRSYTYVKQVLSHKIDMAIAWDFEKTVKGAYRWLSDNYKNGDRIFLFGFSRGAFQVRVLSAMIDKVGLIHKGNKMQIPFAYALYAASGADEVEIPPVGAKPEEPATKEKDLQPVEQVLQPKEKLSQAARFKRAFSRDVKVHFVGVWDTVSSIGVARAKKTLPGTIEGMKHVCFFRQALALDERRVKFQPEYAYGGRATDPHDVPHCGDTGRPHTLEVWFAGTHSDIGGGNVYNREMNRSRPPLRWMAEEAKAFGLRMKPFTRELDPEEQINFVESLTGIWHLLECCCFRRLTFSESASKKESTWRPHWWAPRKIHEGQKIHSSLILGDRRYTPKATLPGDWPSWDQLRSDGLDNPSSRLEIDLGDYTKQMVRKFLDDSKAGNIRRHLQKIAEGKIGAQALYDEVFERIKSWQRRSSEESPTMKALLDVTVELLNVYAHPLNVGKFSSQVRPTDEPKETAVTAFLRRLTAPCIRTFESGMYPFAISSDGTRIVSGQSSRIWDAQTGELLGALERDEAVTKHVAISSDGTNVAFVSEFKDDFDLIQVWDVKASTVLTAPKGRIGSVRSVAISPDGTRVVLGSADLVWIWDPKTRDGLRALKGHKDQVNAVAISSDGTRVVSGSSDHSVRIWNAQTGSELQELEGHEGPVWSVAISGGMKVISGSEDRFIRIWDAQTGDELGVSSELAESVDALAISSDETRIVSGCSDQSVQVWDWDETTWKVLRVLKRHTAIPSHVAMLSDKLRVVSADKDGSVWNWRVFKPR